jgi:hypothetical protein
MTFAPRLCNDGIGSMLDISISYEFNSDKEVPKIQMDRKQECEWLEMAGLEPATDGEILAEVPGHNGKRSRWWPKALISCRIFRRRF